MIPEAQIKEQIRSVVAAWQPMAVIAQLSALTPDASLRRYFRVTLRDSSPGSVLAMHFDSVSCPEVGSGPKVDSDLAYIELSRYLRQHAIAVPELLFDARESRLLLIEDLGDRPLAELVLAPKPDDSAVTSAFESALEQIVKIQSLKPQPGFFPFERSFNSTLYRTEMSEFSDFLFSRLSPTPAEERILIELFEQLGRELDALPQVLVHRDFHAWNLMLDQTGRLRVIDFQDALKGTSAYDLVSLLNDRDMDSLLGEARYLSLISRFQRLKGSPRGFVAEYDRVLLQRDLKVSGRFGKLSTVRGLKQYERWIPGTVRRIGTTLERVTSREGNQGPYWGALRMLSEKLPDVAAGAKRRFRIEEV